MNDLLCACERAAGPIISKTRQMMATVTRSNFSRQIRAFKPVPDQSPTIDDGRFPQPNQRWRPKMIRAAFLTAAIAAAAVAPASAASLAYLAHNGSGAACTLAAPCNLMSAAVAAAGANGVVICLDKGQYSGAFIGFAITISCGDGLWENSFQNVTIQTPAGSDVVIEGLVADVRASPGLPIEFLDSGSLHLRRARVGNLSGGGPHGLNFAPTGAATLHVSDSVFYSNSSSGIHVRPTGSGYANVHMRNVKFERNANGLFIDGSASTVGINVDVTGGVFAENSGNGIGAFTTAGKAGITVSVKDAQITGNLGNGIGVLAPSASGAGSAAIEVGNSMISGNVNGIAASSAGQIRTFGNNQLRFNGNNGAFTGSVGLQ